MARSDASRAANQAFFQACAVDRREQWAGRERFIEALGPDEWRIVARHAQDHGFAGLLARNLAWAGEVARVRVPVLEPLSRLRQGQLVQHLARKAAARRILEALRQAGIDCVAFKGAVLAEEVYGDLSLRGFRDFDVMVRVESVDAAYDIARDLGYSLDLFGHVRELRECGAHAAGLSHADGSSLDLHWSIAPDLLAREDIECLWENVVPASPGATLAGLRFSPEMTLVHLAKHFHTHQYASVKPLVDFYVTARRFGNCLDAHRLAAIAGRLGMASVVDIVVRLCERVFPEGTLPPALAARRPGIPARIARRVVSDRLMLEAANASRLSNWLRYLAAAGSWRACVSGVATAVIPGKLVLTQFFHRPFRPRMYPRYYWRQLVKVVTLANK